MFKHVEKAPEDPILGLNEAFKKETSPNKINLGVGVYKNEDGDTPILECVKRAEKVLLEKEKTKSYLSIQGTDEYTNVVKDLIFGKESPVLAANRAATVQSPGGTGALRIAADFIRKFLPKSKIWLSDPTWENHRQIFNSAGIETSFYPYYNAKTKWLYFEGMTEALLKIPSTDVVLFHACCHNPTGVDINKDQWETIAKIALKKGFLVLFDFAYQGLGNGLDEDAFAIRLFADKIKNFMVSNSFSKNFGLYNERVGALTVVAENSDETERVLSQLKLCIRVNYSNPPGHGSSIVTTIVSDPELNKLWLEELKEMRDRIQDYRHKLVNALKEKGAKQNFDFVMKQRGMFSYTGLTPEQVNTLREKYALYMVSTGRINLAGINAKNINELAQAITEVILF